MNNRYNFLSFPFVTLILLSLCLFVFFLGIGSYGLLDKDEPRYCGTALEMLREHNWIVPKFNFQNRFDKPILFYWLIAISYKFFGISDFSSRLPSAVCAMLTILFTWYVSKVVFGKKIAFLSALVLLSSVEFVLLGKRAATDMALCLFFTASLYSTFLSYYIKNFKVKIFWCICAGVFCGLSILTKGPVGILLPLVALTFFLFVRRQFDVRHLKVYFIICFFAFLISFPWYFMVHYATGGEFTKDFFFEHNLKRFTSVVGEHPGPFWFYIPVVIGGFMPWSIFMLYSMVYFFRGKFLNKKLNKLIQYCLVWIITVFLFFSFSTTKLATYILLIFPPLSILTGFWLMILCRNKTNLLKNTISFLSLLLTSAIGFVFKMILDWKLDEYLKTPLLVKMAFLLGCFFLGILLLFQLFKKNYSLVTGFALCFVFAFVLGLSLYLPLYYTYTHFDLRRFAEMAKVQKASQIISFGMYRPSLVYYSAVPVDFSEKKRQKLIIKDPESINKNIYVVGHVGDIKDSPGLFENIQILEKGKKYFIGKI